MFVSEKQSYLFVSNLLFKSEIDHWGSDDNFSQIFSLHEFFIGKCYDMNTSRMKCFYSYYLFCNCVEF